MIEKFVPDIYSQSIYRIDYEKLKNKGIKLLIFDLDNTISVVKSKTPPKEAVELMVKLKELGFTLVLMSNSKKERVLPFKNKLEIDACASSKKPFKKNYKKILEMYRKKPEETAGIGDQIITDIYGANNMGICSILVNPISKKEKFVTKINRFMESIILFILKSRDLFKKGAYYD